MMVPINFWQNSDPFRKVAFVEHTKRWLNPKDEPSISKIERVTVVFVGQGMTKSHFLQRRRGELKMLMPVPSYYTR